MNGSISQLALIYHRVIGQRPHSNTFLQKFFHIFIKLFFTSASKFFAKSKSFASRRKAHVISFFFRINFHSYANNLSIRNNSFLRITFYYVHKLRNPSFKKTSNISNFFLPMDVIFFSRRRLAYELSNNEGTYVHKRIIIMNIRIYFQFSTLFKWTYDYITLPKYVTTSGAANVCVFRFAQSSGINLVNKYAKSSLSCILEKNNSLEHRIDKRMFENMILYGYGIFGEKVLK